MALGWRKEYYRYKDFFLNILVTYRKRQDLRMFLEVILSISTIIIFSAFALRPTILTIIGLSQEIKAKEETLVKLNQKILNLERARASHDQEGQRISLVEEAVPLTPFPEIIIRQIEGVAARNDVEILGASTGEVILVGKDVSQKEPSDIKPLPGEAKGIPLSISARGTYQNLTSFLKDLESLRRPLRIDTVGLSSSETEAGKVIVLTISARTPFLEK